MQRPSASANPPRSSTAARWLRRLGGGSDVLASVNPRDRMYYTISGLTMLLTFVVSAGTLGTVLVVILHWPVMLSVPIGALWGFLTLTIDRFLIESFPRPRWRALVAALPSILIALLVGIVTTEPLVLWLFRADIEARLDPGQSGVLARFQAFSDLQEADPVVGVVAWLLRISLTALVCLPVLVRLLRPRTVQDAVIEYLEGGEQRNRARSHFRRVERTPLAGPGRIVPPGRSDQ